MTPEAALFLEKARKLLVHADTMLDVGLNDDAGRTAYLAGFHAAQAFIFERIGKTLKTHKGVQMEFLRLTRDDPRVPTELQLPLPREVRREYANVRRLRLVPAVAPVRATKICIAVDLMP